MLTPFAFRSARALIIAAMSLGSAAPGVSALAQSADPSAPPISDQRNSAAALKDTIHDRRIAKAETSETGIWKWVVPPVKMTGAYDNNDPIGVITGRKIHADCSINWTDPDTHKLYCFSSATSLVYFLDAPKTNIARADKAWRDLKGAPTG